MRSCNPYDRVQMLQEYVDLVVLRDVAERHNTTNIPVIRELAVALFAANAGGLQREQAARLLDHPGLEGRQGDAAGLSGPPGGCVPRVPRADADPSSGRRADPDRTSSGVVLRRPPVPLEPSGAGAEAGEPQRPSRQRHASTGQRPADIFSEFKSNLAKMSADGGL